MINYLPRIQIGLFLYNCFNVNKNHAKNKNKNKHRNKTHKMVKLNRISNINAYLEDICQLSIVDPVNFRSTILNKIINLNKF